MKINCTGRRLYGYSSDTCKGDPLISNEITSAVGECSNRAKTYSCGAAFSSAGGFGGTAIALVLFAVVLSVLL